MSQLSSAMKRTELAKLKRAGCYLLSSGHTKKQVEKIARILRAFSAVKVRKTSGGKYAVFTCGKRKRGAEAVCVKASL